MSVLERISKHALATALILTLAAGLARPPAAWAGRYHVYSCRMPDGESAPADGWHGEAVGASVFAENTCDHADGALVAAIGDDTARTANANAAKWIFETPAGETLAEATLWRASEADGGSEVNAGYQAWLAAPTEDSPFDECGPFSHCGSGLGDPSEPLAALNRVGVPANDLASNIYAVAACTGTNGFPCPEGKGANGYAAAIYLYAADLILEQAAGPSASNVSGELANASTVQGTSDVAFSATDPGAGVYEAVFSIDGQVAQSAVLDENGGRCKDVGETTDGLPAFLYVQPCLQSVSADVGFDTTKVSNGVHHLVVSVVDAAGNSAPVLDRTVTVDNPAPEGAPGPPNGTNASADATLAVDWKGTRGERMTSDYSHTHTIVGQLTTAGGQPISGALINVLDTPDSAGAATTTMVSPRTNGEGRFTVYLPAGLSSRTLHFAYRSQLGEALPVVTRTLTLSVHASIQLDVAPHTSSVGHSIHFTGLLHGEPMPGGGKSLVLEARSPGGPWLEFDVIRTNPRGRYHASYRFKFPGPARYQFRVLSEAEADFPFAGGSSNVVEVAER